MSGLCLPFSVPVLLLRRVFQDGSLSDVNWSADFSATNWPPYQCLIWKHLARQSEQIVIQAPSVCRKFFNDGLLSIPPPQFLVTDSLKLSGLHDLPQKLALEFFQFFLSIL